MVHPNVLRACGIDPDVYQGFAWGMGIDRIAMLKYGMPDLRQLFESDVRWLSHYGFRPLDMPTLAGGLSAEGKTGVTASNDHISGDVTPRRSEMTRAPIDIIYDVLRRTLGPYGFDHAEVKSGEDHAGE